MRFILFILLFILPIASQAQKDKLPKNGKATIYFPSTNKKKLIKASGLHQNSLKEGEWQFFTTEGSLDYTQEFVQGQEHGKKKYYINNLLIVSENYSNALLDGEQTYYGVDGSLLNSYFYSKGRIDSVYVYDPTLKKVTEINTFYENKKLKKWTVYFPTGEIKGLMTYDEEGKIHGTSLKYAKLYSNQKVYLSEKANYKHGVLNGEYLLINDGVLRSKKEFKDGELNGTCYEFYSGANLKSEEEYVNGHLKGKCIYYAEDGGITDEAYYSGKLVGRNFDLADSSFTYYGNSQLQSKTYATFLPNSNLEIRSFEYYEKGQVLSKVIRLNGELDGIQTSYYENGQLKSQVGYVQGLMHGKASYWYKNGKKKLELVLNNNYVIKQSGWNETGKLLPINSVAYQTIYYSEINSEVENEAMRSLMPFIDDTAIQQDREGPNENYGLAEPQYSVVEAPRDQYSPGNNASKATFPGGKEALDSFIVANIRYPESQRALSTKANLTVYFLVNANGTISEISFEHLTTPQEARFIFETDVRRVLNLMPKWIPAKSNNQNIAQYQSIFIQYRAE
jgi:antitoxin component YwqK of YwqJK toxin-antitoxin module